MFSHSKNYSFSILNNSVCHFLKMSMLYQCQNQDHSFLSKFIVSFIIVSILINELFFITDLEVSLRVRICCSCCFGEFYCRVIGYFNLVFRNSTHWLFMLTPRLILIFWIFLASSIGSTWLIRCTLFTYGL
jgi:hypothetical protein